MTLRDPYQIIKHEHVTEKASMLLGLQEATSNPSLRRCESPKYVFVVHPKATKHQIADAVEQIYSDRDVKVVSVNTINVKPKATRRRGRRGTKPGFKKAIVTLEKGNALEDK
jgi:large subunit ribosomal protein L23